MMENSNWAYDKLFEQPRKGMKQQQLITLEILHRKLVKTTITRKFYADGDYQDHTHTEVICDCAE